MKLPLVRFSIAALLCVAGAGFASASQIAVPAFPVEGIDYEPLPAIYVVAGRGTVKESSIEIINRKAQPLEILGIENPSERFTARVESLEPGRRYRFIVSLKGQGPGGDRRDIVSLKTNLESSPVLRIPVNTRVREKVYTFPDSVFLGRFGLSEIRNQPELARQRAQILMVYRKATTGFEIKVASDIPFLRIKSERGPKGDRWENTIWLDPERAKPGEINGTISIETNDPEVPKLTVPVTGKLLGG
jgi:hypothetical protein